MGTQNFLVVGSDGQLGSNLASHLRHMGRHVYATYFLDDKVCPGSSFLDLGGDVSQWRPPGPVDAAFLCAAITSVELCRTRPEMSRKINVENTLSLARKLSQNGAALFFPSSNLVFDGLVPFRKADDPVDPGCEYGRQKVETEQGLKDLTDRAAIVRFTKIISSDFALLKNWAADLRQGKPIHPFSDMVVSPVSLPYAIDAIIAIMRMKSYGLWQISARQDLTYEEFARCLARKMGVSQELIKPVSVNQSGLVLETLPEHTTLDTTRLREELGINPPDALDVVEHFLKSNS